MSRLSRSRISRECGAARMLRWPSARGPNSDRAVHPADDAAGGEIVGDALDQRGVVELFDGLAVLARRARQLRRRRPPGPRTDDRARRGPDCRSRCDRHRAPRPARSRHRPAPAARTRARSRTRRGCARWRRRSAPRRRRGRDRAGRSRDAARARCRPACPRARAARWRRSRRSAGPRRSRDRSARRRCAAGRTDRRTATNTTALAVVWYSKYSGIERERAVRRAADQLAHLLDHRRAPVGGEAHHLVLVLVDREAEIGGERRIEHAERVREPDFAQQRDVGAAVRRAARRGRPSASPIRRRRRRSGSPRGASAR